MKYKNNFLLVCIVIFSLFMIAADFDCTNEYVFLVETQEEAEEIAEQYGGELVSFSHGIAVLRISSDGMVMEISEEEKEQVVFYQEQIYTVELEDTSESEEEQWHLQVLGVEEAWKVSKGENIKVAVIDSGIDSQHEDFNSGVIVAETVIPTTEYGDDARFESSYEGSQDNFGHGTHVAGIIGARDNGIGCNGIAPECNIISIKALEKSGSRGVGKTSWVCAGIRMAIDKGADIINMSLGGTSVKDELLLSVIQEAVNEGIVVVCAAGNITGTQQVFYPGAYEETIAVSALKQLGDSVTFASSYSNYGDWIDISAPGSSIKSTIPGGYGTKSGTSMACPVVTGAIALLQAKDMQLTSEQICTLLYESATDMGEGGKDEKYGHGVLNVKRLLECYAEEYEISRPVAEIPDGSVVGQGTRIKLSTSSGTERIVYTIDGTIPNKDSEDYPIDGMIFSEEMDEVTILARCVTEDGRLGKCISFSYSFVAGECSIERSGVLEEIIPNYGAYIDPILNVPCRRYGLLLGKGETLELTVNTEAFEPVIKIYDGREGDANLLSENVLLKENGWSLSWRNETGEEKNIWISISIANKVEGYEEMKYKVSWKNVKETVKKEPVETQNNRSEEVSQESATSVPSKKEEIETETSTEILTEEEIMSVEIVTVPQIQTEPLYEDDWLYTMNIVEECAEVSEEDVIIEGSVIGENILESEEQLYVESESTIASEMVSEESLIETIQESTDMHKEKKQDKVKIGIFVCLLIAFIVSFLFIRKGKERSI